ncbi:MAG: hypothetical protein AAGF97_17240 [Planctomycetota bacterium]
MHTIELLEEAVQLATQLGYDVRQEWLGGCGGGACEVAGRRLLFLDSSLGISEQLEQIVDALGVDPALHTVTPGTALAHLLGIRRAA